MAKMRTCMLVTNAVSNDARVLKEAAVLQAEGYEVIVIGAALANEPAEETISGVLVKRVRRRSVAAGGFRLSRSVANVLANRRLSADMMEPAYAVRADIYHAHDIDTLPAAASLAASTRSKLVYDSHEFFADSLGTTGTLGGSTLVALKRRYWIGLERRYIKRADLVITVADAIADRLAVLHKIERPLVIRNVPPIVALPQHSPLRRVCGAGPDDKLILYQGGLVRQRGLDTLLRAMAELPGNFHLVLLGGGQEQRALEELAKTLGVSKRVTFAGVVPWARLPEFTAGADLGVVPIETGVESYRLSLPNKLFEYMMAGLPIVASDLPGNKSVLTGADIGRTFRAGDSSDLARAVLEVLADADGAAALGRRGRELALAEYNWAKESTKLVEAYGRVVGKARDGKKPAAGTRS